MVPALLLGVVFTALFQGMMLAMATRLQALSIGFVAQCKVLPDYACSLLASGRTLAVCACHLAAVGAARQPLQCPAYKHESLSSVYFQLHLLGAALVLGGALSYARLRLSADARCTHTFERPAECAADPPALSLRRQGEAPRQRAIPMPNIRGSE